MLPAPRTPDEAHLYLDLHSCEVCGSVDTRWEMTIESDGAEPVERYAGTCAHCGNPREFSFELTRTPILPKYGEGEIRFGGDEPSRLLDAGEWLAVSDRHAKQAPLVQVDGVDAYPDETAWRNAAIALAAVEEVLKFIPDGRAAVPDSAFWSPAGRIYRDTERVRFRRDVLGVTRDTYLGLLGDSRHAEPS